MTVWADLTPSQQATLISSPALEIATGVELLNFDLTLAADITSDVSTDGADITWTGAATVHRDCQITVAEQLDWGNTLIRIYRTYTDLRTGLSVRADRGVFVLIAPDRPLGETPSSWQVTGQDRLYLLNRQVGRSYTVASGTSVLTALTQVFVDAGLTGVLIDSSRADATVPTDMVWPLIPVFDTSTTTSAPADSGMADSDTSGPATWLQVVNDLQQLIAYRGVWCDEQGNYRCGPYADPSDRPPIFSFDATDPLVSTVSVDRTETGSYWATDTPNLYIFTWSNMPPDLSGNEQTPSEGNGIYTVTITDGPTSPGSRNGLIWPAQVAFTAASQDDLVAQGNLRVAADLRQTVTVTASTVPFPASHYDVFTLNDPEIGSAVKVEAQTWTEALDSTDLKWTWQEVS